MRCPSGKKTKLYKRAKLEKFAHYLMKDGLVCRLSVYDDKERKYKIKSQIYTIRIHYDGRMCKTIVLVGLQDSLYFRAKLCSDSVFSDRVQCSGTEFRLPMHVHYPL